MPVLKTKKGNQWVEVWGSTGGGSGGSAVQKLITITLLEDSWIKKNDDCYSQVVVCSGINQNSKLDPQPTPEQWLGLCDDEISLMASNNNGVVTVYSFYGKPSGDIEMQFSITDVEVIS